MIEILNESNFQSKVIDAPGKVLVEFFATWCPHCQREMPVVNEFALEEAGAVTTYQVDVDASPELANIYAPDAYPTFVLFEDGMAVQSVTGEQPLAELERLVA